MLTLTLHSSDMAAPACKLTQAVLPHRPFSRGCVQAGLLTASLYGCRQMVATCLFCGVSSCCLGGAIV